MQYEAIAKLSDKRFVAIASDDDKQDRSIGVLPKQERLLSTQEDKRKDDWNWPCRVEARDTGRSL